MTTWGDLVRKVERIGRALLRLFAGARRVRRRAPLHVVQGPPRHWVERVQQGAPGLLEPSAREQVAAAAEPRPVAERRVATLAQLQRSLRQLRPTMQRRVTSQPAEPAQQSPPPAAELPVQRAIARQDPPPEHGPPPAPEVSERAGPLEQSAAPAATARSRTHPVAPSPALRPAPAQSEGLSPIVSTAHLAGDSPWTAPPRPKRLPRAAPKPPLVWEFAERRVIPTRHAAVAARVRSEPMTRPPERSDSPALHLAPPPEVSVVASPRADPWPELPSPVAHSELDAEATVRVWARERRLDREQAGL